ncbi:MAG: helix-turn-helix domain-containing protein [Planctomycetia bacterium]|nr:helix-turn-helix domain-containing protein [Planctomycetia bacterium]
MRQKTSLSDAAVLTELGERLAHLRLHQNLTQAQLAREAGVSKRTLIRLEHGESSQLTNLIRVLRGLGVLGNLDAWIPPPLPSPIEHLRSRAKTRRRASPATRNRGRPATWTWGDESPRTGE